MAINTMIEESGPESVPTADMDDWGNELVPPEGHEKVGVRVFEILEEILADKEGRDLPRKWTRNYELTRNKHWKRKSTQKVSLVSANLVFKHRQRTVNLLTDNNPTFNVRKYGRVGENTDVYSSLLHTCEFWWGDTEQQHVFELSVTNGETYGCTIEKVRFNSELEHGLGEVETELVDPFYFGIYPVDTIDNQKGLANLHFYPMTVRDARRMWPEYAEEIKSDTDVLDELGDDREQIAAGRKSDGWVSSISNVLRNFISNAERTEDEGGDKTLIVEAWVKDYTMVEEMVPIIEPVLDHRGTPILNPDTGEPEVEQTGTEIREYPKYPGHIRCIWVCNGGRLVLEDRPNPSINPDIPLELAAETYLFDKFPFSLTQSVSDTTDPWGVSDIDQLDTLQMEINKAMSQFTMVKDKAARLKLINPKNSGVENSEFDNAPGIINPANDVVAQAIRYVEPPTMPVDIANGLQMFKELFFMVAGSFELEGAQEPGKEVIAYKAIAALIEQASTMLKGKIRNYSKMVRERGRMYLSHVMNWYTEDRWITYEEDGEDVSVPVNGRDLIAPAKLIVVSGSTMPISKVQEREEALALFQMGAIDLEELHKKLEWPDRKSLLRRMELGPIGQFVEKLVALGLPEPFAQYFMQIAQMEPKDLKKGLEKGEIPTISALLQAFLQSGGMAAEPPNPKEEAEIQETMAKVQLLVAQAALTQEQINSERVQQEVSKAGVGFDEKKLRIEEAETLQGIKHDIEQLQLDWQQFLISTRADMQKERIKGEAAKEKAKQTGSNQASNKSASKVTSSRKKRGSGAPREKGLKSNNKKK